MDDDLEAPGAPGLKARVLGHGQVLGQSIANIGPSSAVAVTPAAVFAYAANATLLSFVLAAVVVLLIVVSIAPIASRHASAGSLQAYAGVGLPRWPTFAVGWSLVIGYTVLAMLCLVGSMVSLQGLAGSDGFPRWAQILVILAATVAIWLLASRDIRVSARLLLWLEIASVLLIVAVIVATLVHVGSHFDSSLFHLSGVSAHAILLGTTFATVSWVGFESAASLGVEARDPQRAIPRALLWSSIGAGVFYLVATYSQVAGFQRLGKPITQSASPLADLAQAAGVGFLKYLVSLGLLASFVATGLASVNAAARVLLDGAQRGDVPAAFARIDPRSGAPIAGIRVLLPALLPVPVVMILVTKTPPLLVIAYLGTVASFGFLVAYLVTCVGVPAALRRLGHPSVPHMIAGALSVVAVIAVLVSNVYPVPPSPFDLLPYWFLGLLVLGFVIAGTTHRLAQVRPSRSAAARPAAPLQTGSEA